MNHIIKLRHTATGPQWSYQAAGTHRIARGLTISKAFAYLQTTLKNKQSQPAKNK